VAIWPARLTIDDGGIMTRSQRMTVLAVAALVLVGAFVLLRPTDDEPRPAAPIPSAPSSQATDKPSGRPATATPSPPQAASAPLLSAGEVRKIAVEKGETVRFRVRSSTPEELHVHGYDLKRDLPAGSTVRVSFNATIEGIFEVELEGSGTQIAELRVQP